MLTTTEKSQNTNDTDSKKNRVFIQKKCACGASTKFGSECADCEKNKLTGIQAKLKIGAANDRYEQEADRIADQVMSKSQTSKIASAPIKVQRLHANTDGAFGASVPSSVQKTLSSSGKPLHPVLKHDMETRFGHNFSNVRIHTGTLAANSARDINARAYTSGNNIVFSNGQFSPYNESSRRLLAHELTHVIQQTDSSITNIMRQEDTSRYTGCSIDQMSSIESALRTASLRCQLAVFQLSGAVAPVPGRDTSGIALRRARFMVRKIFGKYLDMTQVQEIVSEMRDKLMSPSLNFICDNASDNDCEIWNAYVVGNRGAIHLCPGFFSSSSEQKIRTLIHEAAHLSGIGEANGESYCTIFDCESTCGGFNVADSWAHLVHCLSSQSPDTPEDIQGEVP